MRFIIFAFYSISFAVSMSAIAIILLFYLKKKQKLLLLYLLVMLFVYIYVTLDGINYFIFVFTSWLYLQEIFGVRLVYYGSMGMLLFLIPYTVHVFLEIRFNLFKKILFGFLTVSAFFLVFVPYLITPLGRGVPDILLTISDFMGIALFLELIYIEIICMVYFKKINQTDTQSIIKTGALILGFFLLLDGFDISRGFFFYLTKLPFIAGPMLMFFWNLASLIVFARFYFLKPPELVVPELAVEFLERYGISSREKEIILLLSKGLANKQIGGELNISSRTVKNHIYNIYKKAGVTGRVELLHKMKEDIL
jgi:DNA-binding CsgD family transcriptional regulator